jgi:hypothetical protein
MEHMLDCRHKSINGRGFIRQEYPFITLFDLPVALQQPFTLELFEHLRVEVSQLNIAELIHKLKDKTLLAPNTPLSLTPCSVFNGKLSKGENGDFLYRFRLFTITNGFPLVFKFCLCFFEIGGLRGFPDNLTVRPGVSNPV